MCQGPLGVLNQQVLNLEKHRNAVAKGPLKKIPSQIQPVTAFSKTRTF